MGLRQGATGTQSITTTPYNLVSEIANTLAYHHIKLFFAGTFQATDRYQIIVMSYDPILTNYVRQYEDEVNFESVGNTTTDANQNKTWEMVPSPGYGMKLVITKIAGNNMNMNYEIIQAT
jgi:hypothetical protein